MFKSATSMLRFQMHCTLLSPEAAKRNVALRVNGLQRPLPVRADRIHLQQVILILVTNGMDAMTASAPDARRMTIQTAFAGESLVEVSVSNSGLAFPSTRSTRSSIRSTRPRSKAPGSDCRLRAPSSRPTGGRSGRKTRRDAVRYFASRCRCCASSDRLAQNDDNLGNVLSTSSQATRYIFLLAGRRGERTR